VRLSEALHAVVSQRLLPRADGNGRAAALEVMICTDIARDMIKDQKRTSELPDYIGDSREKYGMQTFDQHLMDLVADDIVTPETALAASSNPSEFQRQVKTLRRRSRVASPAPAAASAAPASDKPAGLTDDLSSMLPQ
jgi:twitching motility protein PilT